MSAKVAGRYLRARTRYGVAVAGASVIGAFGRADGSGERSAATRTETRYGCFLPDLTGLARRTSATDLPATISALEQVGARANWSRRAPSTYAARPARP